MAYMKDSTGRRLDAFAVADLSWDIAIPAGLGWDTTNFGFAATITSVAGAPRSFAIPTVTAESLFDAVSTARSAPGATFYVDWSTGSDANAGTSGLPFKSIWKAIVAANAANVPTKIFVATPGGGLAGAYYRTNNPWYNGGTGVVPAVDIALIATGGRVTTGTFDATGTPSRDATYTNCYSWAVASANRVCDMANTNTFGNYNELVKVATAALCNATPDSWALVTGTLYVNRRDQVAPTSANTRVYRPATKTLSVVAPVNIYIGGATDIDGFDFEGGSAIGVLDVTCTTPGSTRHVIAIKNCTFKYGGGYTDTTSKGVAIDSFKGLTFLDSCRTDANWSDGINGHNNYAAVGMHLLTVNCAGFDNGRQGSVSNNGWTTHENVLGIDLAGYYESNRGGTIRSIGTSKSYLAGTTVKDDLGDLSAGGSVSPTAFRTDDTAVYWCDRTRVLMAGGGNAYVATAGAAVHRRAVALTSARAGGPGTVDTY